ncbi:MAG: hypothetical protein MUC88_25955 [Planctomycetes bacterium]|jgi:hypothetical protein|nr:hypothetical protein [Planctomycetota bacterium]
MKVGYCVEGSTDRVALRGLQQRWCPQAQLVEGSFRGTSGLSQRREIPKICVELLARGAELIVFLRDANDENWRQVLKTYEGHCRADHQHLAIFGVCDRNVECWCCTDADWIGKETGRQPSEFRVADPKGVFEEAMGVTRWDRKEEEVAALVQRAPLRNWLGNSSFEQFYERIRDKSKERGCQVENLRAS